MASNSKKNRPLINDSNEDRISNLPDALLHHILSFLTTDEVVKTCVLSKRWRYVWTCIPFLYFDYDLFPIKVYKKDTMVAFTNFINQVLLRHQCSHIVQFRFHSMSKVPRCAVESWIHYAAKHHVQDLCIFVCYEKQTIVLPRCFYSCDSLTRLKLISYEDSMRFPKSLGFSSLKTLHLEGFGGLDGHENIFSSCPNLETLILEEICIDNLNIHALNLKFLKFVGLSGIYVSSTCRVMIFAPKLTKLEFVGREVIVWQPDKLTCPDEVIIDLDEYECGPWFPDLRYEEKQNLGLSLMNMLNEFHCAKSITLSLIAIEALSQVPAALNEHPAAFSNLKCLRLKTWWCNSLDVPACILTYFLNRSTLLKVCSYCF